MQEYSSEQEQIEAIKKWWSENGLAVVLGVVVALGGVGGWKAWQQYLDTRAEEASVRYVQVMNALEDGGSTDVEAAVNGLLDNYAPTPYAPLAAFAAANIATSEDQLELAAERLQWIIDNARQEQFIPLARLRLARLHLAGGELDQAEALIDRADYPDAYTARRAELQGDLYAARSDYSGARSAYDTSLGAEPSPRNRQMIEIKRDNLPAAQAVPAGDAPAGEAPAGESAADA